MRSKPTIPYTARERALILTPIVLFLFTALAWAYHVRPYQVLLAHYTTSLSARSEAQRQNILVAARQLDGTVIGRGERFSFNEVVGPRTMARGFTESNAYMEGTRTRSLGGGVCQLSSTLYAALQETTLPILKRVPHALTVGSVPPGRDATVWYGQADLVWENTFQRPIKLVARATDTGLRVELWGTAEPDQRASLRFSYRYGRHSTERVVWVFRRTAGKNVLLSHDTYKVAASRR